MPPAAAEALLRELRAAAPAPGAVSDAPGRRAQYAFDASNYRRPPLAVVRPHDAGEVAAVLAACRRAGVPLTMRGAGTSIAGQALGSGVVLDTSVHLDRILDVDPRARTATVEPGVVLDDLQAAVRPHGLRFGPDPSTHARCTVGGMIGNNACGSHSPAWGTTADNVLELDVLTADGRRLRVGRGGASGILGGDGGADLAVALRELTDAHRAVLRTELGRFPRQVSGYGLHHLLPERGGNLAAALTGTEGGCVVVLAATVRLVEVPAARSVLVLGFDALPSAGDAVTAVLPHRPLACEGLGAEQVESLRRRAPGADPARLLPAGHAWLMCEFDASPGEAAPDPQELRRATGAAAVRAVTDPAEQRELVRLREESAGLATRAPDGAEAWPGWEDAAVPPAELGGYLRGFLALLERHRLRGTPYGHFGEGCVHVRIDFDLASGSGREVFRAFLRDAALLAAEHGGTLSGEHGDGQARSELLPLVYSPGALAAFEAFKRLWDPSGLLNPGSVVRPRPFDADLRIRPRRRELPVLPTAFSYPEDGGDLDRAVRRCVGVAKCRTAAGGVMCPSWRATGEEAHSTRGRARLLDEMLRGLGPSGGGRGGEDDRGSGRGGEGGRDGGGDGGQAPAVVRDGWRSTEVRDALDLCLSCKGCKTDCPVGVDMATYKAEFLHHHYAHRVRPAAHYSMGRLPVWARAAGALPGGARVANAVLRSPAAGLLKRVGGLAPERELPVLAEETFRSWFRARAAPTPGGRPVVLWPDTFTDRFAPAVGRAAVEVLEHAGFTVSLPPEPPRAPLCCGLTWISTGQLTAAARHLTTALDALTPALETGTPVVALEPSCAAVFRSDARELLPGDRRAARAADPATGVVTLAELLDGHAPDVRLGTVPPRLRDALTQTHCHQHAVLGSAADDRVLRRVGVRQERLDSGCCGLAGNFGFEAGHYGVSVRVAEHGLLPALRSADPGTAVLADGFSCRTQVTQLTGRRPLHLAEVVRAALPGPDLPDHARSGPSRAR